MPEITIRAPEVKPLGASGDPCPHCGRDLSYSYDHDRQTEWLSCDGCWWADCRVSPEVDYVAQSNEVGGPSFPDDEERLATVQEMAWLGMEPAA